jgi:hypothetical protein
MYVDSCKAGKLDHEVEVIQSSELTVDVDPKLAGSTDGAVASVVKIPDWSSTEAPSVCVFSLGSPYAERLDEDSCKGDDPSDEVVGSAAAISSLHAMVSAAPREYEDDTLLTPSESQSPDMDMISWPQSAHSTAPSLLYEESPMRIPRESKIPYMVSGCRKPTLGSPVRFACLLSASVAAVVRLYSSRIPCNSRSCCDSNSST